MTQNTTNKTILFAFFRHSARKPLILLHFLVRIVQTAEISAVGIY